MTVGGMGFIPERLLMMMMMIPLHIYPDDDVTFPLVRLICP